MRNIKVIMSYRGTDYHGFQTQKNAVTIQETVEKKLAEIINVPKAVIYGCSRTDTGVHANCYCFNFKTESKIPVTGLIRGLNGKLPDDISILSAEDVNEDFHARFSCKAKEYIYIIHNSESRNPFASDLALHYRTPLNIGVMREASEYFLGTHDFKSMCSAKCDKETTIRTIYALDITENGNQVIFRVKGDGFLYNMVRIMVGTLIFVSEGKIKSEELPGIILSLDRTKAGKTVQPHGLYLNRVFY